MGIGDPTSRPVRIQNTAPQREGREYTNRGFDIFCKFEDSNGSTVRVQLSSAGDAAYVWLFCVNPSLDDPAPHLDVEQAKIVRDALDTFIAEHG